MSKLFLAKTGDVTHTAADDEETLHRIMKINHSEVENYTIEEIDVKEVNGQKFAFSIMYAPRTMIGAGGLGLVYYNTHAS